MFKITHTTPKRVLSHLLRLQREGETLAQQGVADLVQAGRWEWRMLMYLRRVVADEKMFDRLPAYQIWVPTAKEIYRGPIPLDPAVYGPGLRKRIKTRLVTLSSVIDQLEAHIEHDTSRI